MKDKGEIETGLANHIQQYGDWIYDISLPHGLWTRGEGLPHTRLKRVLQIIQDISAKPLSKSRILDLGCLEGIFSIEFALHGADVTGIEIREASLQKAMFAKEAYDLTSVVFIKDDVRNISSAKYGFYDIVLCSGILYHLPVPDVFDFITAIYEMTTRATIIDTHISLHPSVSILHQERLYHGHIVKEHDEHDSKEIKERRVLSSIDNTNSFCFSRPSFINLLSHTGFSSVYEGFNPPHLNFGRPGLEHLDRCTFVAIKGQYCRLHTSPLANSLKEDWPEGSLSYGCNVEQRTWNMLRQALLRGRSLIGNITPNRVRVALGYAPRQFSRDG